jgi:hypothetical protein
MRTTSIVLLLAIAAVHAACGGGAGLASPSPVPHAAALAWFSDPDSDFTTTDVRDAQDEMVQFNTAGELVWAADGSRHPGYIADGRVITAGNICTGCYFYVRFGTRDGTRRAYLTWAAPVTEDRPATLLDVAVIGGVVVVHDTDVALPEAR